jgi:hypothetical protein
LLVLAKVLEPGSGLVLSLFCSDDMDTGVEYDSCGEEGGSFRGVAPFSSASAEDGNFLLVLVVRLTEIVCREWRLLTGEWVGAITERGDLFAWTDIS